MNPTVSPEPTHGIVLRIPVEIELRHVPFAGWTVKRFEVGELR